MDKTQSTTIIIKTLDWEMYTGYLNYSFNKDENDNTNKKGSHTESGPTCGISNSGFDWIRIRAGLTNEIYPR